VDIVRLNAAVAEDFIPRLARSMDLVFRHHIRSITARNYQVDPEGAATVAPMAIGFADIVGFTARSGSFSTKELTRVIDDFESRVAETVTRTGGRVVKFIGDEVLFAFENPSNACRCALDLLGLAADDSIPDVRVGLAHGEVISRYGDYYGPVVNLAARLVDIAPSGGVLVTRDIAEEAGDTFEFAPQEAAQVKGIDLPVEHFRLLGAR
jgi:adenylate cyclase